MMNEEHKKVLILSDLEIFMKLMKDNPGTNISELHMITRISYSRLHLIMNVCEEKEWIGTEKVGVKRQINLTDQGRQVAKAAETWIKSIGIPTTEILKHRRRTGRKSQDE